MPPFELLNTLPSVPAKASTAPYVDSMVLYSSVSPKPDAQSLSPVLPISLNLPLLSLPVSGSEDFIGKQTASNGMHPIEFCNAVLYFLHCPKYFTYTT